MSAPPLEQTSRPLRPVRSFVRHGRLSRAQRHALESLLPHYGVADPAALGNLDALFGRCASKHLEIGFGMGDALAEMAACHPENDYLGIEVHRPGVGALLLRLQQRQLGNVRIWDGDVVPVLAQHLASASLDAVYIFFPDPWPKKRHHKRRLIQPPFARQLRRVLKPGGLLHLATDWQDYARHMQEVLDSVPGLVNTAGRGGFVPRPRERPRTKFEQRGERLGHDVWDLSYRAE